MSDPFSIYENSRLWAKSATLIDLLWVLTAVVEEIADREVPGYARMYDVLRALRTGIEELRARAGRSG